MSTLSHFMSTPHSWRFAYWLAVPALVAPVQQAVAIRYLTVEQAQQQLFPAATSYIPTSIVLSDAQRETIEELAGSSLPEELPLVWRVMAKSEALGFFFTDNVVGKHDYITYAAAISSAGQVIAIEILEYRENYGGEVRNASWRVQFTGKKIQDPVKLGEDIINISGATFSCRHLTDGVRRLLAIHKVLDDAHL